MNIEKLTIAHISDLHRSEDNPLSNVALLNSLLNDKDEYTQEGISVPDILIVSGDIVQGSPDVAILVKQYDEALEFLNDYVNKFFDGDKSRIIVVPGNHDISWTESKSSMQKIEEGEVTDGSGKLKSNIFTEAIKIDSNIKWSWSDRSFYRITDQEIYKNRLSYFSDFYQKLYDGKRSFSIDPDEQFEMFDFPEFGITIVGFNSCFHNDHLNRAGSINPTCIGKVGLKLRELNKQGRLILSTWHHNTRGAPYDQDYMDDTCIQNLITSNVKIGFHGHQHKQNILSEKKNVIDNKAMYILSAGSLCVGPKGLPSGYDRQYNLLELSRVDTETVKLMLFSRVKTQNSSYDNPIWQKGTLTSSTATEFSTIIEHPKPAIPKLSKAEKLLGIKDHKGALAILLEYDLNDPIIRIMILECYVQLEEYSEIFNKFSSPKNNTECIALLNSSIEIATDEEATEVLNLNVICNSTDPSVRHLRDQLKGKIK